jgi:hypothetical protein
MLKDLIIDLARKKFVSIINHLIPPPDHDQRPAQKQKDGRQILAISSIETEVLAKEDKTPARNIV